MPSNSISTNSELITPNSELTPSRVSVLIPMIRPDKGARCAQAARDNAGIPPEDVEILLVQDVDGIGAPAMVKKLTGMATHDLVCFLGDDTIPQPGFLAEAIAVMNRFPDRWGLVALNDGIWDGSLPTHWLAHKRLLPYLDNEFFSTAYTHCFCDNELMDRTIEINRYAYAPAARIIHDHPHLTGEWYDDGYKKAYRIDVFTNDQRTYWTRKVARMGFNLAIALPLAGNLHDNQFWLSYCAMEKPSHRLIAPHIPVGHFAHDIASIREDMARQALQAGMSHVLFLDTDQIYPPDTIPRLLSQAAKGWDIVVAPVHRRYPPFELILKRGKLDAYTQVPDEEAYSGRVIEIDAAGTGCMLIDTRVLIAMDRPWFEIKRTPDGNPVGEDISFCARARSLGFRICADTAINIDHIAKVAVNRTFCEIFKDLERKRRIRLVTNEAQDVDKIQIKEA